MNLIRYYLYVSKLNNNSFTKRKWEILIFDIYIYIRPIRNFLIKNKYFKNIQYNTFIQIFNDQKNHHQQKFNTYYLFTYIYQQQFISNLLKSPTVFKNINIQDIIPKELLAYMMYSVKSIRWKKFYIIHSNEIIEMLFLCLWLKNINLFIKWIRKYFEKNNLKKHKKLFLLFKYLFGSFIWNYNLLFKLKGIRFILRGKFGKAGSVRKSRKYIKRGKCSYTSKNIALVNQTKVIRTTTGVFSIKLEIFF